MNDNTVRLINGDSLVALQQLPDCSIDSCVTDPPYELGFMGKKWDSTGIANNVALWREVLRVLKPGAHLLAFSGTRTYHRMVCAIEDAGFEIRDQIGWLYGSGFPKSLDVSKAIDKRAGAKRPTLGQHRPERRLAYGKNAGALPGALRCDVCGNSRNGTSCVCALPLPSTPAAQQWSGWGTALKPAWEPIVVARKALIGTVAENVLAHRTGAINVDACRVGVEGARTNSSKPNVVRVGVASGMTRGTETVIRDAGRWPANIIHDGSEEVEKAFQIEDFKLKIEKPPRAARPASKICNLKSELCNSTPMRFFYCAKASKADRDAGCEAFAEKVAANAMSRASQLNGEERTCISDSRLPRRNHHPTVKPTALMRYLCRLVTPPGGRVLDPFLGSGSTGKAARLEGFRFTGIELSAEYLEIAKARIGG